MCRVMCATVRVSTVRRCKCVSRARISPKSSILTVEAGLEFFEAFPRIMTKLQTLNDVGLGYVRIGQSAPTLSGGEAQRVKLGKELSRRATGKTLYVLDEPSVGLHAADVHKLIEVLQRLVDAGNSVIIIEHNLDIIKVADHLIDLGPEGGDAGGEVLATGTPEQICRDSAIVYRGVFAPSIWRIIMTRVSVDPPGLSQHQNKHVL